MFDKSRKKCLKMLIRLLNKEAFGYTFLFTKLGTFDFIYLYSYYLMKNSKRAKMDKVSIIIPTRNRSSYLERALEHAFAQDYPNFEVIVSNNASTDDTAHVLESLKTKYPNLISVHHPELLPLSTHWDKVIRDVSTGNIILLIPDDDVIIDKCYLSKAVRLFEKYPSIGLVFANFCSINPQFQRITNYEAKFDEFIPKEFLFNNYNKELFGITGIGVPHLTALFSRKAYLDVGDLILIVCHPIPICG
jgi:glycosyltransferase involved in cell wall biosynthesis